MTDWFKRNGIHFAIAGIFVLICFLYFNPAFQGKTLGQSDVVGAQSTQKEIMDYRAKGTTVLWSNQVFGGMPAYQLWAPYSSNIASHLVNVIHRVFPNPIGTVLLLLSGAYFLFLVLKLNPWLAAAGAIAFTFSSYNIILLAAGHANQAFAIAFFAPILAGIILTFRGKYYIGAILTVLFLAMEIKANHIQMTYYLLLGIFILVGIELYHAIKSKKTTSFFKSIVFLSAAVLLALAVNASLMWSTYEYSKYSYRGQSNLTKNAKEPVSGLDKEYVYQYSQGVGECLTFLVPNAYGGASGSDLLNQRSEITKIFANKGVSADESLNYAHQISSIPGLSLYWGEKRPFTAGPFYFGAVICFLFVFGMLIVKNRIKWWLVGTVLLTMLLSFGGNWPYVSDLFFDYFPLYNKFRAVESILAVAGLCVPILGFLSIQEIVLAKDKEFVLKKLKLAFYITAGLSALLILVPGMLLDFSASDESNGIVTLTQALKGDNTTARELAHALVLDRTNLERSDAIRSFLFILSTFGLVWAFVKEKINLQFVSIALLILSLIDLWQVDKRYLKDANFTEKREALVKPREVDLQIAKDTDPNFRVFDATANIKMDIQNPFFHKSLGGYSAARLKRYEELIDNQMSGEQINPRILNMLNTKYIITPDSTGRTLTVSQNEQACGNAWFIQAIKYVTNADAEMEILKIFSPEKELVADQQYKQLLDSFSPANDSLATIKLVHYSPDSLSYRTKSATPQLAVFSEIYYEKGWKMFLDGQEKPYFRADYLLRAAQIPAGEHQVDFIFHPASYYTGENISLAGSIVLVLLLGGAIFGDAIINYRKKL
ncbi:YfhO family protein [Pedobacter sp. PAMC26386]|nr:YfhO family protein [Pedobacter sp. PAMC26386]